LFKKKRTGENLRRLGQVKHRLHCAIHMLAPQSKRASGFILRRTGKKRDTKFNQGTSTEGDSGRNGTEAILKKPKRKKTQAIRPETSTQKKLRQKNYEEGEKVTEANTPRRKPQMPKQPRNRREKREQGKESSTEEEGSKK
jgi:hypothetical protein